MHYVNCRYIFWWQNHFYYVLQHETPKFFKIGLKKNISSTLFHSSRKTKHYYRVVYYINTLFSNEKYNPKLWTVPMVPTKPGLLIPLHLNGQAKVSKLHGSILTLACKEQVFWLRGRKGGREVNKGLTRFFI